MTRWAAVVAFVITAAAVAAGCSDRPRLDLGARCSISSDCEMPFVCERGRCRRECMNSRDCEVGLSCDPETSTCQLRNECELTSDCSTGFVCIRQTCTSPCRENRDCPHGASCTDAGVSEGEPIGACVDMSEEPCERNSDCPANLICAVDERCREQCWEDRDCRDGRTCDRSSGIGICVIAAPAIDAGPDASADMDGGVDGGDLDGGVDGGDLDGGVDGGTDGGMMMTATSFLEGGFGHTCRVRDGALACWGYNASGQVGIAASMMAAPTTVLTGVIAAAPGGTHSCAVTSANVLYCWGSDASGQLGGIGSRTMPAAITLPFMPAGVSAGNDHTCALSTTGEVWCWGKNDLGQLGRGATSAPSATPMMVVLPMAAARIVSGGEQTFAFLIDGSVYAWGRNTSGQLGIGSTTNALSPAAVIAATAAYVQIDPGNTHTCAVLADATAVCWGEDTLGQLGNGAGVTSTNRATTAVAGLTNVVEVAAGVTHSCAVLADLTVHCWGDNINSQLARPIGAPIGSHTPLPIAVAESLEIGAGEDFACVRTATQFYCWGRNDFGQLGDPAFTTSPSATPRLVAEP